MTTSCPKCLKDSFNVESVDTIGFKVTFRCKKCGYGVIKDCDRHGLKEGYQEEIGIQEF